MKKKNGFRRKKMERASAFLISLLLMIIMSAFLASLLALEKVKMTSLEKEKSQFYSELEEKNMELIRLWQPYELVEGAE